MNAPVDPEETHGAGEPEDPFGENSQTWGAADPDFDRMLRERVGPLPEMPTPPYAFERVLLAGRRRRVRKVWAAGAAAALVVMAGTAGTTVALHGPSSRVATPAAGDTQQATTPLSSPSLSPSASPSPSATVTQSPSATATSAAASASPSTSTSIAQCHSDDLQLTVSLTRGGDNLDDLLIVLHNNSAHACTTVGFPGLQTETQSEQLQSTTVTRVGKSQKLTLGPGQYASTLAEFTTLASGATATPTGGGCGAPSYYLAVIPPNEQSQIVAPIQGGPVTVCGKGIMDVSPLTMGKTG